jgi:hypothetical protein
VPDGAEVKDANEIIPKLELFKRLDSYSPFSNLFRYTLLQKKGGWWVDSDVIYQNDPNEDDVIFAWEDPNRINTGQLKMPAGHVLTQKCIEKFRELNLDNISWGATGPTLFTTVVKEENCLHLAKESSYLYPIHWTETYKFWLPEFEREIVSRTRQSPFIHAWGSVYKQFGLDVRSHKPFPGSFLDKIYRTSGTYDQYKLIEYDYLSIQEAISAYLVQDWVQPFKKLHQLELLPVLKTPS